MKPDGTIARINAHGERKREQPLHVIDRFLTIQTQYMEINDHIICTTTIMPEAARAFPGAFTVLIAKGTCLRTSTLTRDPELRFGNRQNDTNMDTFKNSCRRGRPLRVGEEKKKKMLQHWCRLGSFQNTT
jgi:hypothetical protein